MFDVIVTALCGEKKHNKMSSKLKTTNDSNDEIKKIRSK